LFILTTHSLQVIKVDDVKVAKCPHESPKATSAI
jgi:hypothetical protein